MTIINNNTNKLSRELLRWIQSLDLAYSIKNVKRDFSNGFLVAEILSRYFDKEISMHSYDNGIGIKVKKDNWEQIYKFFSKIQGLEDILLKTDIDNIIHCENGAIVDFLNKLYTKLTKKIIQMAPPKSILEEIPPYAKPTGTAVIRNAMNHSEFQETKDELELIKKVQSIHNNHEDQLQLEKSIDSGRFSNTNSLKKSKILRGSNHPMETEPLLSNLSLSSTNVVKEVQIKTLNDTNIAILRAQRLGKTSNSMDVENNNKNNTNNTTNLIDLQNNNNNTKLNQSKRLFDILNQYILLKCENSLWLKNIENNNKQKLHHLNIFELFLDSFHSLDFFTNEEYADIIQHIMDHTELICNLCLEKPKDYWKFTSLLCNIMMEQMEESIIYQSILSCFCSLGEQCVKKDPSSAILLFSDFSLPKFISILMINPTKRNGILKIVSSFSVSESVARIQMIKRLREAIPDIPIFIHCLAILLSQETIIDDDTLLDLYHYYCIIGLNHSSEILRSSSVYMLSNLLRLNHLNYITENLVYDLIPYLVELAGNGSIWWELKAQILIIISNIIYLIFTSIHINNNDNSTSIHKEEIIKYCLQILQYEFTKEQSLELRRLGLSCLSINLPIYPDLIPCFIDILLTLPTDILLISINNDLNHLNELQMIGYLGNKYNLRHLPSYWDSIGIIKQIGIDKEENPKIIVEDNSLIILLSCFNQLKNKQISIDEDISILYKQVKNYIINSIQIPSLCEIVKDIYIILSSMIQINNIDILDDSLLKNNIASIIQTNNNNNNDYKRQEYMIEFFKIYSTMSNDHKKSLLKFLNSLETKTSKYKGSMFHQLYNTLIHA